MKHVDYILRPLNPLLYKLFVQLLLKNVFYFSLWYVNHTVKVWSIPRNVLIVEYLPCTNSIQLIIDLQFLLSTHCEMMQIYLP